MRSTLRALVALLTTCLLVLPTTGATAKGPAPKPDAAAQSGKPLTVMTRNIYLGGDIMRPIAAVQGKTGTEALVALGNANHQLRQIVDRTDFATRAGLLAREIATRQPDLVGLQEVALWRSGPMELGALGVPNATHVDYDFLAILLEEIEATGASYRVVAEQQEADVEAPAFPGAPNPADPQASDQRLTMHDVVLMRADKGLRVTDSGNGNYARNFSVNLLGLPLTFLRGYNWVDVRDGANRVRFINTHLESVSSDVALAQARELLAGPADHDGDTVIVCDCNSDPLNHTVKPPQIDPEGTPHSGPYDFITGEGFVDQWLTHAPAEQGWTAGLSETVDDATPNDPGPVGLDHRIDMVLARGDDGRISADKGWVTGDEVADKDPATGLWPSDHAGVVLRLRELA